MVLIWLYKGFDDTFLLCGKTYGTIRQYPMAIRSEKEHIAQAALSRVSAK